MIRPANNDEANILTKISFESKGYWNYPEEYFEIWKNELTISPDYIEKNNVFIFQLEGSVVGYYSIVVLKADIEISGINIGKGYWLEHMFIEPLRINSGIGSKMFHHLNDWCLKAGVNEIGILADPNSKGFYEKMGCIYVREYPSTIKNRTTPYLIFKTF